MQGEQVHTNSIKPVQVLRSFIDEPSRNLTGRDDPRLQHKVSKECCHLDQIDRQEY